MIGSVLSGIRGSTKQLFGNWRSLLVLVLVYAGLLVSLYEFLAIGLATMGQVIATLMLAVVVPILFFLVQAICVNYPAGERGPGGLLESSLKTFLKLAVITIPIVLLVWLLSWLIAKIPVDVQSAVAQAPRAVAHPGKTPVPPTNWKAVGVTTLDFIVFAFAIPLAAMHLWISAGRDGLKNAFKRVHKTFIKSFAPVPVLTYVIGFVFFAVIPYFLIVPRTPVRSAWLELGLLGIRLLAAALFALFGWAITVGALAARRSSSKTAAEPA